MIHLIRRTGVVRPFLLAISMAAIACSLACPASSPTQIFGPAVEGGLSPTLEITSPTESFAVNQGTPFIITWKDADPDSSAFISYDLIETTTGETVKIVDDIPQADRTDAFTVQTSAITVGSYYLRGTITDNSNPDVTVYAYSDDTLLTRTVITITEAGLAPTNTPPQIVIISPEENLVVAQDDPLFVWVQPTEETYDSENPAATPPYDPEDTTTLYLLLDYDDDPTNDNYLNPQEGSLIALRQRSIAAASTEPIYFQLTVDLTTIPIRSDGLPYYIRCTITDGQNPAIHAYAAGTINVAQGATGTVDLAMAGLTLAGARFNGFNPGAHLGSSMTAVPDFDGDGIDDFIMAAQFGNHDNEKNSGEAYLIYGLDRQRLGGISNVNSITRFINGLIFTAPRTYYENEDSTMPATLGIADVGYVPDLNGDNKPELLFGLPFVDSVQSNIDFDPGDSPPDESGDSDETETVVMEIRQGRITTTVGGETPTTINYVGVVDSMLDSSRPNTAFGEDKLLQWQNQGVSNKQWPVFRFLNLKSYIFPDEDDSSGDYTVQNAELTLQITEAGNNAAVHQLFTSFDDLTTYSDFGEPTVETDYAEESLGTFALDQEGGSFVVVDITELAQSLIDGDLDDDYAGELRLIVNAGTSATDETVFRSSDSTNTSDRPLLTITYTRPARRSATGCYSDVIVNNYSSTTAGDTYSMSYGMVPMFSSQNNNAGGTNAEEGTYETFTWNIDVPLDEIGLFPATGRCGGPRGHYEGARMSAGWTDTIDAFNLNQPPLQGRFGEKVAWIPPLTPHNEYGIIISAPNNEKDIQEGFAQYGSRNTQYQGSYRFDGSIQVFVEWSFLFFESWGGTSIGSGYYTGSNEFPPLAANGDCTSDDNRYRFMGSSAPLQLLPEYFTIYAEDVEDYLSDGQWAGDFNLDGVPDILCGAKYNDNGGNENAGTTYIIYGRLFKSDFDLKNADDPANRPPMLRIRGEEENDRIGYTQERVGDVNGDRIDDIIIGSPNVDFNLSVSSCGTADSLAAFEGCREQFGEEVFSDDACKIYDYNNDRLIDDDDEAVFTCLASNNNAAECCPVDNGFAAIIFGGIYLDGDRTLSQIASSDLPGAIFYGASAGDRAGEHVSSAGDFNRDGFSDFLIVAPGVVWIDDNGRQRLGVTYLVFGGTHLNNNTYRLDQVGSSTLPGMILYSPYVMGRPNEAPPAFATGIGDINNDGFDDISIGFPLSDFLDQALPQDPNDPGTDPNIGRRKDNGSAIIIYGNNIGSNQ